MTSEDWLRWTEEQISTLVTVLDSGGGLHQYWVVGCILLWVDAAPATRAQCLLRLLPPPRVLLALAHHSLRDIIIIRRWLEIYGGEAGKGYMEEVQAAAAQLPEEDYRDWLNRYIKIGREIKRQKTRGLVSVCFATKKMYTLQVFGDDTNLQEVSLPDMIRKNLPSPVDELFMFVLHSKYAKMATTRGKLYYVSGNIFKYLDLAAPNSGWCSIPVPVPTLAPLSMTAVGNKIFYNTGQGDVGVYCPDTGRYLHTIYSILNAV